MKKNYYFWSSLALVLIALCSCSKSEKVQVSDLEVFGFYGPVRQAISVVSETDSLFTEQETGRVMANLVFNDGELILCNGDSLADSYELSRNEFGGILARTYYFFDNEDGEQYCSEEYYRYDDANRIDTLFFETTDARFGQTRNKGYKVFSYDQYGYENGSLTVEWDGDDSYMDDVHCKTTFRYSVGLTVDTCDNWIARNIIAYSFDHEPSDDIVRDIAESGAEPVYLLERCFYDYQE